MSEKIAPVMARRLSMQRYIKENISLEDYPAIEAHLARMAELRGDTVVPTIDDLLDERYSPDVFYLGYIYDKLEELKQSKRDEMTAYIRDYISSDWSRVIDIIRISGLSNETVANIVSGDKSVPMADLQCAYMSLYEHINAQTEEMASRMHK